MFPVIIAGGEQRRRRRWKFYLTFNVNEECTRML